jgi:hypothetical protein
MFLHETRALLSSRRYLSTSEPRMHNGARVIDQSIHNVKGIVSQSKKKKLRETKMGYLTKITTTFRFQ